MTNNQLTREKVQWLHDAAEEAAAVGIKLTMKPNELLMFTSYALAAIDSETNRNPVLAYADSYRDMAKQGVELVPIWGVITDLERNIAPLYRHAQPALVVPDRSIFEKWWESQNGAPLDGWDSLRTTDGYCDDGIDGQFEAWNAAMLQAGNSPVIPEGYVLVPIEPTSEMVKKMRYHAGSYDRNIKDGYKAMLSAAPQEVKGE